MSDEALLLEIAILLESGQVLKRARAMKRLGVDDPSNIRRIHGKFSAREAELRAEARRQLAPPVPAQLSPVPQPTRVPSFNPGNLQKLLKAYENSPVMKALQRDSHYLTKWQRVYEQTQSYSGIAAKMAEFVTPRHLKAFEEIQRQNSHLLRILGVRPPDQD